MEETNVTMTAEEMQGEPAAKENETKAEKFMLLADWRILQIGVPTNIHRNR